MRIGVDLDGVCYDFQGSLAAYLENAGLEYDTAIAPSRWEFYLDWGMTMEEFIKHCHDGVDAKFVFNVGKPLDSAESAIKNLRDMGHSVHIITDRSFGKIPAISEDTTREWLNRHHIEYDSLTFSPDKTCVKTDVFIEDKLENYDALDAADVEVYLVNRPWNKRDDNRRRVKDIQEFVSIVSNSC
jgi:5'(3')-deoxyribonucleotidase